MSDDDTLRKFADRIQARAIRRCGQLLKAFDKGVGAPRKMVEAPLPFLSGKLLPRLGYRSARKKADLDQPYR